MLPNWTSFYDLAPIRKRLAELVDFDAICLTNVNRQLHALDGTIGQSKAVVMAERCRAINPAIVVEPLQEFYSQENSSELLERGYDYVLDCIDHVTAKLYLLQSCKEQGIPVITSMGAANKIDPTRIGVMGSSAGGHLAASAGTAAHRLSFSIAVGPSCMTG